MRKRSMSRRSNKRKRIIKKKICSSTKKGSCVYRKMLKASKKGVQLQSDSPLMNRKFRSNERSNFKTEYQSKNKYGSRKIKASPLKFSYHFEVKVK